MASGAENIKQSKINIFIGGVKICHHGKAVEELDESEVKTIMSSRDFDILIELNSGYSSTDTWTCDLSYDYIKKLMLNIEVNDRLLHE